MLNLSEAHFSRIFWVADCESKVDISNQWSQKLLECEFCSDPEKSHFILNFEILTTQIHNQRFFSKTSIISRKKVRHERIKIGNLCLTSTVIFSTISFKALLFILLIITVNHYTCIDSPSELLNKCKLSVLLITIKKYLYSIYKHFGQ